MVSFEPRSLQNPPNCAGSNPLVDLLYRHMRSIVGQDFWVGSETDLCESTVEASKNRHYAFLELFVTVSFLPLMSRL